MGGTLRARAMGVEGQITKPQRPQRDRWKYSRFRGGLGLLER